MEFRNTREKAIEIWEELEMSPTDEAGKQLQQGNVSKFVFSEKNMACLAEYYEKVEENNKLNCGHFWKAQLQVP